MKEMNYTEDRIRLLFIVGMIVVFIVLFTSFLYPESLIKSSNKDFINPLQGFHFGIGAFGYNNLTSTRSWVKETNYR